MNHESGRLCIITDPFHDGNLKFSQSTVGPVSSSQSEWNGKWNKKTLTYAVIRGTEDIPGNHFESLAMSLALTTYEVEIPIKFKKVKANENPDLRVEFKTPEEDHRFKESPSVLAYAYFPAQGSVSGSVVFNENYHWSMNGIPIDNPQTPNPGDKIRTYNLIHVMIHELGHSLGLRHDENSNTKDVMDPYYDGKVLDLSPNDIIRIRQKYGVRIFKKWSHYQRMKNWLYYRLRRF